MTNIDFFEVTHFDFVSKIEGHTHNNGTCHEKYDFTDRQCDLTNESGSVQASFFLSSLAVKSPDSNDFKVNFRILCFIRDLLEN